MVGFTEYMRLLKYHEGPVNRLEDLKWNRKTPLDDFKFSNNLAQPPRISKLREEHPDSIKGRFKIKYSHIIIQRGSCNMK